MKQTQFDKYTIAWFKIAECVSRGEKERALGVYRLLSYSFNDNAIARQLEADIYLAFGEHAQASALYRQALDFYQKSQRLLESAAVCEHLIAMSPADMVLRHDAVHIYKKLGLMHKMETHLHLLIDSCVHKKRWQEIEELCAGLIALSDIVERIMIYRAIIISLYASTALSEITCGYVEKAVEDLCSVDDQKIMHEFLSALRHCADELYEYALACIKK